MNIKEITRILQTFSDQRDWNQFHTPKNLAMALNVEASELLELFQWSNSGGAEESEQDSDCREDIAREVADIMIYLIRFCDVVNIDLEHAVRNKIDENEEKYPVSLSRGNAVKYSRRD
ncbi:MAG: nucleotide pyrophosphohydrolase [Acidiferrobacteraceae bacterium]|nr:nucleotide pyrophosphohydrolase [Acidiferrobacteraceae bacterium]|tara:strand:+ start:68 stop:421 length:354 start_codon:yes stop_codon:yes gene_type:complete